MMRGDAAGACLAADELTPGSSVAAPAIATPLTNSRRSTRRPAGITSAHHARRRMPFGCVRQFLEVVIDDVGLGQIFGILDELRERHPRRAIRQLEEEETF